MWQGKQASSMHDSGHDSEQASSMNDSGHDSEEDKFKDVFKYFKRKKPPPDFSHILQIDDSFQVKYVVEHMI